MTPTRRAAVLGSPIAHSRSPILHNAGYRALGLEEWEYERIEATAETLPSVVSGADASYAGFSVTMPAKFAALAFADTASRRAQAIGSANTLVRTAGGWHADNTDCDGVTGALGELFSGKKAALNNALVLGAGGTARPALWALGDAGVHQVTVVNRSSRREELEALVASRGMAMDFVSYSSDLETLAIEADVIVSTAPSAAIEGHETALGHAPVLDVIYEPWPTPLTIRAASNGYPVVGGHVMLAHQAYGQFVAFTGRPAPQEEMRRALEDSLR